ncbi:MAG: cytochrome c3 family protein [Steroidobacteraceae bacterium]
MKNETTCGCRTRLASAAALLWALLLGLALLLPAAARAADEEEEEDAAPASLSEDSQACQDCHDKRDIAMRTGDGKTLSLYVPTTGFLASRHNTNDCTDCHEDIEDGAHAKEKPPVASQRAFAASMIAGCISCHKKNVTLYQDGVHAAMVKEGSDKAPLCTDCHAVHTLLSVKFVKPVAETPCLKCHEEIGKAYVGDVHGSKRVAGGNKAPLCADCHQAHANQAPSFDSHLRDNCLGCHKDAFEKHKVWLPNAGRHFEAISCPVCHAPTSERRVSLRLFEAQKGGRSQLVERAGVPRFETRIKAAGDSDVGLDERALLSLLEAYGKDEGRGDVVLQGRLEVRAGAMAHRLTDKSKALRDCDTCHRQGAQAFQSVVLTIVGPDGRPLRHSVDKQVLSSLTALESVRGFYAIGATRIKLLDWLLLLVVVGSVGGVCGHMAMKWWMRRERERGGAPPPRH